ncbi:MAG: hypothetical protein ABIK08_11505 [Pseudomonadota bacterium]
MLDTMALPANTGCTVLNTPHKAAQPAPESRGFFTSVACLWPGSAKAEKQPEMAKAQGRPCAVFKYLAAPLNRGRNLNEITRRPIMAAQISSARTAPARLYRYRVTVQLAEGRYETTRCAKHPMDAGMAVLKKLGFNEDDPHHPPLALFVVPVARKAS